METEKLKIKEFFIERSDRTAGYYQLIAFAEDGREFIIDGDYCGGVPVSSWHALEDEPSN